MIEKEPDKEPDGDVPEQRHPEPSELEELDELSEWSEDDSQQHHEPSAHQSHQTPSDQAENPGDVQAVDHSPDDAGPPHDEPPAPLSPQEDHRTRKLWLLILALTAALVVWQHWPERTPDVPVAAPLGPPPQLLLSSRMNVALHQLGTMLRAFETQETRDRRLAELRQIAEDRPIDQVRVAIVAGELDGSDAGLRELDRVDTADDPAIEADIQTLRTIYTAAMAVVEQGQVAAASYDIPIEYDPGLEAAQAQRMVDRHGWFGRLALSHRQPLADDQRARVLSEARRTLWTVAGMMLLVGFALLTGIVLLILAIVFYAHGTLRPMYRRPREVNFALLETVAVFLGVMLVGGALVVLVHRWMGVNLALLLYLVMALAVLWPLMRGMSWSELRTAMGWERGESFRAEAGWSLVGYVAGMPILAVGFIIMIFLSTYAQTDTSHPAVDTLRTGGLWTVLLTLMLAVVWAPLVEESLFRGAMYHHLRRGWGTAVSALGTGLLFAVIHPQGWAAVPALAAVGVVLALLREWRGSLVGPICVHAFHNLMVLTLGFLLLR